jgi:hypothetical protein
MSFAFVCLLATAIGCSDAVSPEDGLTAKSLGLTDITAVAGSGDALLLANFSNPSLCLSAGRSGDQAFIDSCDEESKSQLLTWDANGVITTAGGLCLDASGARNGDPVAFSGCTGTSSQVWSATSSEQIVSAGGACLDLERRGGGGNSAVVWNCGGRDSQGWGARSADGSNGSDDAAEASVARVLVSPDESTLEVEETIQLSADVLDADGNEIDSGEVQWRSSNTAVATVTGGLVSAVSAGSTTISATVDGVTGSAAVTVESGSTGTTPTSSSGIWISAEELSGLPTSGDAWDNVKKAADSDLRGGSLTVRDNHNTRVMAAALIAARLDDDRYRTRVRDALRDVVNASIDRSDGLAANRRLGTYAIAADLIALHAFDASFDRDFRAWLVRARDTEYTNGGGGTIPGYHERRPNNYGTHAGASRIAVALYLDDSSELERAARVFRGWVGDRSAYNDFQFRSDFSWHCDEERPVGINPAGCTKRDEDGVLRPLGGVLPDDQRRGGSFSSWPPVKENYVWEALQGAVAQAWLLSRAGYDAFEWQDQALLRAITWLHEHADYPAEGDDTWQPHLFNFV